MDQDTSGIRVKSKEVYKKIKLLSYPVALSLFLTHYRSVKSHRHFPVNELHAN